MTTMPQAPLPTAKTRKRNTTPLILAGLAVLGLMAYMLLGNMNSTLVYYVLPSEYQADQAKYAGKNLRLGGLVRDAKYNRDTLELKFTMTDGQASYPVQYKGAIPDMFRNDAVVLMEGEMKEGTFYGKNLLIKHSEEYKAGTSKTSYSTQELKDYLNDKGGQGQ